MLPNTLGNLQARVASYLNNQNGYRWVCAYDEIFNDGQHIVPARARLSALVTASADNGWNMNRQGQCDHIARSPEISEADAAEFFVRLDALRRNPGLLRRIGHTPSPLTKTSHPPLRKTGHP